ncbi:hypothetical protein D019_3759 [Vibrio parahaemolyticus VP2007-095]|nr:hypothetical protein D019_3759 [Vibrio parahaemolyticus VP2007-095]
MCYNCYEKQVFAKKVNAQNSKEGTEIRGTKRKKSNEV